jgi:hypothetical protein
MTKVLNRITPLSIFPISYEILKFVSIFVRTQKETNFMTTLNWDDILYDIANNRAVLLMGHDLLPHTGESVYDDLHALLTQSPEHGIEYYYPNEGFFLFKSLKYKVQAQRKACEFFKKLQPEEDLLKKITELPFRMVVSISPEKSLERAFQKYAAIPQFDFYTWRPNKKAKELVEPSADLPLVYNLFGSVEFQESLILDYEDLFDHLRKLLNDEKVPDIVRTILNEAETYIFLGFHLEKWYTQLLLRYLNMKENHFDDKNKNYTVQPPVETPSPTMLFFKKQFQVNCFGATESFFEELHSLYPQYCEKQENQDVDTHPKTKVDIYIADNKTQHALNVLTLHENDFDDKDRQTLTMLKANFSAYRDNIRKRIISDADGSLQLRQINHAILDFSNLVFA